MLLQVFFCCNQQKYEFRIKGKIINGIQNGKLDLEVEKELDNVEGQVIVFILYVHLFINIISSLINIYISVFSGGGWKNDRSAEGYYRNSVRNKSKDANTFNDIIGVKQKEKMEVEEEDCVDDNEMELDDKNT
eukprot:484898_1